MMTPGRVIALVAGCLLLVPGVGLLVGGGSEPPPSEPDRPDPAPRAIDVRTDDGERSPQAVGRS